MVFTMSDDLTDVIATLVERRDGHQAAAALLNEAIASLSKLGPAPRLAIAPASEPAKPTPPRTPGDGGTLSVYETVLAFASEGPKDWTAGDVMGEAERRGTPIGVKNPKNAVFSAMSRAHRKGDLVRTGHGTYRHRDFVDQWMTEADGSNAQEVSFSIEAMSEQEDG